MDPWMQTAAKWLGWLFTKTVEEGAATQTYLSTHANSPFWRGHKTGFAAYRHRILAAAPTYGLPTRCKDWQGFQNFLAAGKRSGMIKTFKDIHWDMRPHPDFGTLEIRVMDSASDIRTLHGLVAFARCLVRWAAEASVQDVTEVIPDKLPFWIEKQNRFAASQKGLDAEFITDKNGDHRHMRDVIGDLVDRCESIAAKIGEEYGLQIARELLAGRPSYERQIEEYNRNDSARSVVTMLQKSLVNASS